MVKGSGESEYSQTVSEVRGGRVVRGGSSHSPGVRNGPKRVILSQYVLVTPYPPETKTAIFTKNGFTLITASFALYYL